MYRFVRRSPPLFRLLTHIPVIFSVIVFALVLKTSLCEKSKNYELRAGVINAKVTYTPGLDFNNINSAINQGPCLA